MEKKIYKIAVIGGDGIGPEVLAEGIKVLKRTAELDGSFGFDFTCFPWGCQYYLEHGEMMPEDGIEQLSHFDAIYLGAVGYPGVPDHISLRGLLIKIRKSFDEYVNLRPVKLLKGAPCPLAGKQRRGVCRGRCLAVQGHPPGSSDPGQRVLPVRHGTDHPVRL